MTKPNLFLVNKRCGEPKNEGQDFYYFLTHQFCMMTLEINEITLELCPPDFDIFNPSFSGLQEFFLQIIISSIHCNC